MIFKYLKSRLTNKELEEFKKKIVNSKKNQHGFLNPVKLFYDSNSEVIKFTENLIVERYLRFGFKKKIIDSILIYLKNNKNILPEKNRVFINKNILDFKGTYFNSVIKSYIPQRYLVTLKFIKKVINLNKFKKVIDFGCGTNELGKNLARDKNKKVIGMDVIDYKENFNNKNLSYVKMKSPFDIPINNFDLIIMNGVIHHVDICHLDKLLHNISKKLKITSRVLLFEDSWSNQEFFKDKDLDNKNNEKLFEIQKKYGDESVRIIYSFFDWIGNILTRNLQGISMPYNFNSDIDWEKIFLRKKMVLEKKINIGFFKNTLNRQGYVLMVFKKDNTKKNVDFSLDDFLKRYL